MTASLIILTVSLLALQILIASEPSLRVWRSLMAIAALAVLPLAFGPIVPLSHFVFESTGRSMLSIGQSIVALLIAALIWRIVAHWRSGAETGLLLLLGGVVVGQTIWLGSSIRVSDYENGVATPSVWDAPIYVLDWLAALGICVLLALAAWRTVNSGFVYRLLIGIYLLVLAVLAVGTVA